MESLFFLAGRNKSPYQVLKLLLDLPKHLSLRLLSSRKHGIVLDVSIGFTGVTNIPEGNVLGAEKNQEGRVRFVSLRYCTKNVQLRRNSAFGL